MKKDSMKVAKLSQLSTSVILYHKVPIYPGKNEIALLKSIKWMAKTDGAVSDVGFAWLWRKSHPAQRPNFGLDWSENQDVIAFNIHTTHWPTAVGFGRSETVIWDYFHGEGLVLLRPPQLVLLSTGDNLITWYPFFYYELKTITDKEMAKLMAKDHS